MLESKIQKKIIEELEDHGYFVLKLIKTNKNGIPDLLAVKQNRSIFIEVKQEKGVLSPVQKFRINEIRQKKIECYVWVAFGINFDRKDQIVFKP